ncbi:MAG: YbjP/YqhG family protein [Verrucomicrobiaceae bacterium]|nr:YbjP/YqhG family protein [Verrucomicrobiaceae bacterium]
MRAHPLSTLFLLLVLTVHAADKPAPSADALVTELYQSEKNGADPFGEHMSRKLLDHYFTKELASLIEKDVATSRKNNEPGVLDFAPLYGSQDLEIKKLVVNKPVTAKGMTTVLVTFMNYDDKKSTKVDLIQQDGVWKIADFHYTDGPSLRALFKEAGVKP